MFPFENSNQYCGCVTDDCAICYPLVTDYCSGEIDISCGLLPLTHYSIFIQDHFGNIYYSDEITDGNGIIPIFATSFPTGLFNARNGAMKIWFTLYADPADASTPVTLTFGQTTTTCISLTISPPVYITDECGNYLTDNNGNYLIQ